MILTWALFKIGHLFHRSCVTLLDFGPKVKFLEEKKAGAYDFRAIESSLVVISPMIVYCIGGLLLDCVGNVHF